MIDGLEIGFEPHHRELARSAAAFAARALSPVEAAGGAEDDLARRYVALLAEQDLYRFTVPALEGAPRYDQRALAVVREALAFESGFADVMFVMQGLGSAPLSFAGAPALKARILPRVRSGAAIAAFALTEPEAGSDVAALATTAQRDGDSYVLDGAKTLISNAGVADVYVVFAKTDRAAGSRGISAFLVESDTPGFSVVERQRVIAPHPIGSLRFAGCRVPAAHRLGAEGEGFKLAMRTLDVFRPTVGAAAVGMARRALAEALARAKSRRQFGQPIGEFQAVQIHLARMATEIEAARLLVYRVAALADRTGAPATREASMAKLYATEAAQRAIDSAVQIFGGQGVLVGSVVERLYREIRALRIYEGTSEIQHLVIARSLLKDG